MRRVLSALNRRKLIADKEDIFLYNKELRKTIANIGKINKKAKQTTKDSFVMILRYLPMKINEGNSYPVYRMTKKCLKQFYTFILLMFR